MRLTLRTLLAYLDDTLEPAAAKEIGQKLAETPMAQELVSRIREVTRRRRVTAPPVAGDDVDPNTLAEYLDNLLPPDLVARVETSCLESDVHLAEVAACHQILTLIGQPADVTHATRQRMYDLVHAIESIPAERRPVAKSAAAAVPRPSVFGHRPMLARVLTGAAVLLGIVVIVWLGWVSLPPRTGETSDGTLAESNIEPRPGEHFIPSRRPLDDDFPEPPVVPPETSVKNAVEDSKGASDAPTTAVEKPGDDRSPAVQPAEQGTDSKPAETAMPDPETKDATKKEAPAEPATEPAAPASKPEAVAEKPPVVVASYASTTGILLRPEDAGRDWKRVPYRTDMHEAQRVLCLPWYRATVQFPSGARAELVGETELSLEAPADGVDAHLKLDRGRVVLGTAQGETTLRLDFQDQSWRLKLKAAENVIGFQVNPVWRPGGPFEFEALVVVPRGDVELQVGEETQVLGGPVQIRWTSTGGMGEREALSAPPAWLEREELTAAEARAAAALEAELNESLPDSSIALLLVDASNSDRKESRLLGVQSLGAIGRLPALIDAMNTMGRREVRQAAIAALRRHIARGAEYEQALFDALFVKFSKSEEHAQGVIVLLRGYSDGEFQQLQAKDYENLINLLDVDRELLIRELAIMNLEDLAGKPLNTNYNPDKPKDTDIGAWQRAVDDRRLPPKVRGKM